MTYFTLPLTLITQLGSDDFYNYIEGEISPLPRVQLVSKEKYVDEGKINPGSYGIPGDDDIIELGLSHLELDNRGCSLRVE